MGNSNRRPTAAKRIFQLRFIHHEPIVHQFINDFYIAVFIFKFLEKSKLFLS